MLRSKKLSMNNFSKASYMTLSSCLSEYRAQRKAEAFAVWEQRCKDYGHKIGTEAMAKCKGDEYRAYRQRINQN